MPRRPGERSQRDSPLSERTGLYLKSYAWFNGAPETLKQEIRWFNEEKEFPPGGSAIRFAFRRSGVLSGYIVHRDTANQAATSKFDGTLFYQMHLTASVLTTKTAVCTPKVLILCRENEPPDFGHHAKEQGKYLPGKYTAQTLPQYGRRSTIYHT